MGKIQIRVITCMDRRNVAIIAVNIHVRTVQIEERCTACSCVCWGGTLQALHVFCWCCGPLRPHVNKRNPLLTCRRSGVLLLLSIKGKNGGVCRALKQAFLMKIYIYYQILRLISEVIYPNLNSTKKIHYILLFVSNICSINPLSVLFYSSF